MVMCEATKYIIWLRVVLNEIDIHHDFTVLYRDNIESATRAVFDTAKALISDVTLIFLIILSCNMSSMAT